METPETNLVFFDTAGVGLDADAFADAVRRHGVMVSTAGPTRVRACTHLDVDRAGIDTALGAIRNALGR